MAKKPDEYKALTVVNLPFIEERYFPGEMIPRERFEAMAEQAAALLEDRTDRDDGASPIWTADDHIEELSRWGSLSPDPDAEIHPDHIPPDPSDVTVKAMVARAQAMVEQLKSVGADVPAKLRDFAEMSDEQADEADRTRRIVMARQDGGAIAKGAEDAHR